jgi:hypothetical protein
LHQNCTLHARCHTIIYYFCLGNSAEETSHYLIEVTFSFLLADTEQNHGKPVTTDLRYRATRFSLHYVVHRTVSPYGFVAQTVLTPYTHELLVIESRRTGQTMVGSPASGGHGRLGYLQCSKADATTVSDRHIGHHFYLL